MKIIKANVAKSLPYSKARNINRPQDLIYKLRESGQLEGFLPSPTDRVASFKIDYEKTQKIDFVQVLTDVLGEKEGLSLPLLSALIRWSSFGEMKSNLEYQSVLAFPFGQFERVFTTVVEAASRSTFNGKMECDGNMIPIPESERYSQHLVVALVKSLFTSNSLPNSYLAYVGQFSTENFSVLPDEIIKEVQARIPEFPNINLGSGDNARNYLLVPTMLEIIGKKVSDVLKSERNFQQQLLRTSQSFISFFGYNNNLLDVPKNRELFAMHGIEDGAYSLPLRYLTEDFVNDICEHHIKNLASKNHRRHIDRDTGEFSQEKYEENQKTAQSQVEYFKTWVENRIANSNATVVDETEYAGADDYEAWYERREAELKAQRDEAKAEKAENAENENGAADGYVDTEF